MGGATPDTRFNNRLLYWAVLSTGLVLMASIYDSWTDGERDAFKTGWHDCKEDLPPSRGTQYEDEYECDAYYDGFWKALEAKKATAAAALVTGIGALGAWLSRDKR